MVKLFVGFAFLFCAVLASPSTNRCKKHLNSTSQQRIIGGIDAPSHVPYLVSLRHKAHKYKHYCGGAILNENWILTAAHCIHATVLRFKIIPTEIKVKREDIQIRAGNNHLSKQSNKYDVQYIKMHDNWDYRKYWDIQNDIAILKVATPIKIGNGGIMSIEMDKRFVQPNSYANVCGWGDVDLSKTKTDKLQCLSQTITLNKQCQPPRSKQRILNSHICTAGQKSKAVYSGDSGGPLIMDGKIIGIVSFKTAVGTGKPSVFTRMSSYVDWVEKEMKKY